MGNEAKSKAELYVIAEGMYVQDLKDQETCASAVGVTARTIRTWAKEGNWEGKRKSRLDRDTKTREKIADLVHAMVDDATRAYTDGGAPSQAQLYTIAKFADIMGKMQRYEKAESEMPRQPDTEPDKAAAADRLEAANDEITKTLAQLGLLR